MSMNILNDISLIYLEQVVVDEALRSREERMARMVTPAQRKQQERARKGRAVLDDIQATEKALKEPKSAASTTPTFDTPAAEVRKLKPGQKKDTLALKAKKALGESSHLEPDMKKRGENNEKAIEDMKKTKAHKDMVDAARKKLEEAKKKPMIKILVPEKKLGYKVADIGPGGKEHNVKTYGAYKEALDPVGQEGADIDNDDDVDKTDKYLHNRRKAIGKAIKKKSVKEGFSDWRQDLSEVIGDVKKNDNKSEDIKVIEKEISNNIKINPTLGEAVEELGGTLLEMVEVENADCILDDLSESEVFLLSDKLIEEVVEEFFFECIQEGYDTEEVENVLIESIDVSAALLTEAKVTLGHDTDIKSNRLEKVKSAVKKVARGVGRAAGAAVRGARAVGREVSKGYERGRRGSSGDDSSSASQASSSQSDTKETGSKRPGLLGRIGSALKSGLKKAVGAGARKVAKGALRVARKMEGGDKTPSAAHSRSGPLPAKRPPSGAGQKERVSSGSYKGPEKKTAEKPAAPKAKASTAKPATPKRKKTSKLDSLLADIRKEEVEINEKILTAAETKEKERIVKSMKSQSADFEKRYPGRGKEVMYATATKMAEKIAEQAPVMQPKKEEPDQQDQAEKKTSQQQDRMKQQEVQILQRKLQALRSAPKGTDPSITAGYEPEGKLVDEATRAAREGVPETHRPGLEVNRRVATQNRETPQGRRVLASQAASRRKKQTPEAQAQQRAEDEKFKRVEGINKRGLTQRQKKKVKVLGQLGDLEVD